MDLRLTGRLFSMASSTMVIKVRFFTLALSILLILCSFLAVLCFDGDRILGLGCEFCEKIEAFGLHDHQFDYDHGIFGNCVF